MHRLWQIPELASAVSESLDDDLNAVAALGATSKTLCVHAQRVLWRNLTRRSLAVLIYLIDPRSQQFSCSYSFRKERFEALAKLVHSVVLEECLEEHPEWEDGTLSERLSFIWSARDAPLTSLFPHLDSLLVWAHHGGDLETMQILCASSTCLRKFSLVLDPLSNDLEEEDGEQSEKALFHSALTALLSATRSLCLTNVRDLTLLVNDPDCDAIGRFTFDLPPVLPNLSRFEGDGTMFTTAVLWRLGTMVGLQEVVYKWPCFQRLPKPAFHITPTEPWFPGLVSAHLDQRFSETLCFLTLISGPLASIGVRCLEERLCDSEVQRLVTTLASFASSLRDVELDIKLGRRKPSGKCVTWTTFQALYDCNKIERVALRLRTNTARYAISFGEREAEDTASHWPSLEAFTLLCRPSTFSAHPRHGRGKATSTGIFRLFQRCYHLRLVQISTLYVPAAFSPSAVLSHGSGADMGAGSRPKRRSLDLEDVWYEDESASASVLTASIARCGSPQIFLRVYEPIPGRDEHEPSNADPDVSSRLRSLNALVSIVVTFPYH
ncbi:hypothetical protein CALCODRAFT_505051 [Calocera cornea HHB12733]|uniref:F-box domain-containing protein n=1 Tax=Calocera cornea HHB12733 TaxID=1353952 RepID=A0A165C1I6_9BASI|nr:hypothetical protein CALCODRAFT_505051 [Calocera cornea HHB12733]